MKLYIVIANLQSDRYEWDYFDKIWMKYYCLDENLTSCKTSIFPHISGAQKIRWAIFGEFEFFLYEKARLYKY